MSDAPGVYLAPVSGPKCASQAGLGALRSRVSGASGTFRTVSPLTWVKCEGEGVGHRQSASFEPTCSIAPPHDPTRAPNSDPNAPQIIPLAWRGLREAYFPFSFESFERRRAASGYSTRNGGVSPRCVGLTASSDSAPHGPLVSQRPPCGSSGTVTDRPGQSNDKTPTVVKVPVSSEHQPPGLQRSITSSVSSLADLARHTDPTFSGGGVDNSVSSRRV